MSLFGRYSYRSALERLGHSNFLFLKSKEKGSGSNNPFYHRRMEASNLHDLAGWIETGTIFLFILLLGRMATFGYFSRAMEIKSPPGQSEIEPSLPFSIEAFIGNRNCFLHRIPLPKD